MSDAVPVVVVPSFYGYVPESEAVSPEVAPGELLVNLWLSLVDGREDRPAGYRVSLPPEAVLSRELPPDDSLEAIAAALPEQSQAGHLFCFAYDWRRDLTASAARLGAELEEQAGILGVGEIDLVAIGPGALVARYLVESGALDGAAKLVRRIVLVSAPNQGVPAGLLLLHGLLNVFDPTAVLSGTVADFPAAVQLIPPRGVTYLYLGDHPGVRIEPFAWPDAFFGAGEKGEPVAPELTRSVTGLNESLHHGLKAAFDTSWARCLSFASVSEPTHHQLEVDMRDGVVHWTRAARTPLAGDGVVPVFSALSRPNTRLFLVQGKHGALAADPELAKRLRAFLSGPLT